MKDKRVTANQPDRVGKRKLFHVRSKQGRKEGRRDERWEGRRKTYIDIGLAIDVDTHVDMDVGIAV